MNFDRAQKDSDTTLYVLAASAAVDYLLDVSLSTIIASFFSLSWVLLAT